MRRQLPMERSLQGIKVTADGRSGGSTTQKTTVDSRSSSWMRVWRSTSRAGLNSGGVSGGLSPPEVGEPLKPILPFPSRVFAFARLRNMRGGDLCAVTRGWGYAPVLEPDLGLALLHAEHLTDLLALGGGGALVYGKDALEMGELLWGNPGTLALLALGWATGRRRLWGVGDGRGTAAYLGWRDGVALGVRAGTSVGWSGGRGWCVVSVGVDIELGRVEVEGGTVLGGVLRCRR